MLRLGGALAVRNRLDSRLHVERRERSHELIEGRALAVVFDPDDLAGETHGTRRHSRHALHVRLDARAVAFRRDGANRHHDVREPLRDLGTSGTRQMLHVLER